jgi:hypothetical protein
MTHEVDFNHDDEMLVTQIAGRWIGLLNQHGKGGADPLSIRMDLMAANGVNGNNPLDLGKLMDFDDFNFAHDMSGISNCMNRETGKLENHFSPRCTDYKAKAA